MIKRYHFGNHQVSSEKPGISDRSRCQIDATGIQKSVLTTVYLVNIDRIKSAVQLINSDRTAPRSKFFISNLNQILAAVIKIDLQTCIAIIPKNAQRQ